MRDTPYLVVGGGMAGHAAAAAIRELEPDAPITVIAAEPDMPYARPPLSKGLWLGKPEESVWLAEVPGAEILTRRRAVALDAGAREVRDDRGETYRYARLLLATGGTPRRLPFGGERIIYFRTFADYRRLRSIEGRSVIVIGAGFIGSEIAASLAASGKEVTMIFPEADIGARAYPADLAAYLTRTFEEKGVRVLSGESVSAAESAGQAIVVRTGGGEEIIADAAVAGLGVRPDVALAEAAGIRCSDGIEVDERLETSAPGVFAAGDVARFPSAALGERVRIEHEDGALTMGRTAGRNMAGLGERYEHLPFFYSDMFDLGYEAVGKIDARLDTIESWKTSFREGVVYYLEKGRVRGVLLWGVFGKVEAARKLIERSSPTSRDELAHAIPD